METPRASRAASPEARRVEPVEALLEARDPAGLPRLGQGGHRPPAQVVEALGQGALLLREPGEHGRAHGADAVLRRVPAGEQGGEPGVTARGDRDRVPVADRAGSQRLEVRELEVVPLQVRAGDAVEHEHQHAVARGPHLFAEPGRGHAARQAPGLRRGPLDLAVASTAAARGKHHRQESEAPPHARCSASCAGAGLPPEMVTATRIAPRGSVERPRRIRAALTRSQKSVERAAA